LWKVLHQQRREYEANLALRAALAYPSGNNVLSLLIVGELSEHLNIQQMKA
jgi:hypothetical protein